MTFADFSWVLVALSLGGYALVIKKNVLGQWMWAVSNIGWVTFNLWIGAYSQAFLFVVYTGMCVWGIIAWSREAAAAKESA